MQNIRLLVCNTCYDVPQEQLRAIVVPADPVPVVNARTQDFIAAEENTRTTSGQNTVDPIIGIPVISGSTRITQDGSVRSTQQTGEPPNGRNTLPGTDLNAVTYRIITAAYNNGSGLIRLILDTTNGMLTNQTVTVGEVGGVTAANGNWVITVVSTTQIDLKGSTFSGSYTSGGYVINDPSLPYNNTTIPKTGPLT